MRFLALVLACALPAIADELDDRVVQTLKNSTRQASAEKADGLLKEKKWIEAAKAYLDYVARRPDDGDAWYNLACALSRAGRQASAANALQGAFLAGYCDLEKVKSDPDLAALRPTKGYEVALKSIRANKPVKVELDWVKAEAVFRCYVVKPEKFDPSKEYGLIVLLHGHGGEGETYIRSVPQWAGEEFVLAALESPYPSGSRDGTQGYGWSCPEPGSWNWSVKLVGQALEKLTKEYKIDVKRTYLVGSSEGGALAGHCLTEYKEKLGGCVWIVGPAGPKTADGMQGKRFLIAHGVNDMEVPFSAAEALKKRMDGLGLPAELYAYDGGHTLTPDMIEGIRRWLRQEEIPAELRAATK